MPIETKEYEKLLLGENKLEPEKKEEILNKHLETAWKNRDFEIQLFWKRSAYFSLVVGALFVALYTIEPNSKVAIESVIISLVISFLGFASSLVWLLANIGSKFWQENWENHIAFLENLINKKSSVYGIVLENIETSWVYRFLRCISLNWWAKNKLYKSFSVSKLNICLSFIVLIAWLFFFLLNLKKYLEKYFGMGGDVLSFCFVFAILSIVAILVLWFFILVLSRSKLKGDEGLINNDKIQYVKID